jgi:hypothetical protein
MNKGRILHKFFLRLGIFLALAGLLTACRTPAGQASSTASATPTRSVTPTPTRTLTQSPTSPQKRLPTSSHTRRPTGTPTSTRTRRPTRTSTPTDRFTRTPTFTATHETSQLEGLYAIILASLNQGIPISNILGTLQDENITLQAFLVDFDEDGTPDILMIATVHIDNVIHENNSGVWVFKESEKGYQTVFSYQMIMLGAIKFLAEEDVNQDTLPEVILTGIWSTPMMACDTIILVLGWQAGKIVEYFEQQLDACSSEVYLGEIDPNGNRQIVVQNPGPGGLSGGPSRASTDIYTIQDNQYQLFTSQLFPAIYRIHVLQEAQVAYHDGDYDIALQLWDQAAHDTALINYPSESLGQEDQPEIYQPAFALYRMYTTHLILGDTDKAQKVLDEISSSYPAGTPGSEFFEIGKKIHELLTDSQDADIVCPAIIDFIDLAYDDAFFWHWSWGYKNLGIIEFCPVE